jgi:hypothetical protein
VHILTGGAFGCDKFLPLYENGYIGDKKGLERMCIGWSAVIMKAAYRFHYVTPEKGCVVNLENLEESKCSYVCEDSAKDDLYAMIAALAAVPDDPGYINLNLTISDAKETWLDFICGGDGSKVCVGCANPNPNSNPNPTHHL